MRFARLSRFAAVNVVLATLNVLSVAAKQESDVVKAEPTNDLASTDGGFLSIFKGKDLGDWLRPVGCREVVESAIRTQTG